MLLMWTFVLQKQLGCAEKMNQKTTASKKKNIGELVGGNVIK